MKTYQPTVRLTHAVGIVDVHQHGGYPYQCAKLYESKQRKDGVWYWAAAGPQGPDRRGVEILQQDAKELAAIHDCEVLPIRYGSRDGLESFNGSAHLSGNPIAEMSDFESAQDVRAILSDNGWIPLCKIQDGEHWVKEHYRAMLVYCDKPGEAKAETLMYAQLVHTGSTKRSSVTVVTD
ncbi:hypothetical protein LCGC14_0249660 [marine sediment metagenome]|uniref:Uncharacterized protein n=1 Tax=marine sediment metagenome TaxID=412755 RepID=A0A0F9X9V7_9ZZZZ